MTPARFLSDPLFKMLHKVFLMCFALGGDIDSLLTKKTFSVWVPRALRVINCEGQSSFFELNVFKESNMKFSYHETNSLCHEIC